MHLRAEVRFSREQAQQAYMLSVSPLSIRPISVRMLRWSDVVGRAEGWGNAVVA